MLTLSGVGRLGQAPKMQYDKNGNAVTKFSVATDVGFGENKKTIWTNLVAFGKMAETLNQYLDKGSKLAFTADITDNQGYTKKDNTIGTSLSAKVLSFTFLEAAGEKAATPYDGNGANEPEEF
jgi:single-strand DNA-binding protein